MNKGEFPTRENCDSTNPEEAFLWMLVALPGQNGAPVMFPTIDYMRLVSKRLWELGARPVEQPMWEYARPSAADPHWLTSPGRWVKAGSTSQADRDRREVESSVALMGHAQKVDLHKALQADANGEPLPDTQAGQVVATLDEYQKQLIRIVLTSDST